MQPKCRRSSQKVKREYNLSRLGKSGKEDSLVHSFRVTDVHLRLKVCRPPGSRFRYPGRSCDALPGELRAYGCFKDEIIEEVARRIGES